MHSAAGVTLGDSPMNIVRLPSPLRIAPAEAEQELGAESIAEDEQFPQAAE